MIRIHYNGIHTNLRSAVNSVNNLFQQEYFYSGMARHTGFDMTATTPAQLATHMRNIHLVLDVSLYYGLFPFSKVLAYEDPADLTVIHLNKWNLNRSVPDICHTLVFQYVKALGYIYPQLGISPCDDITGEKANTAAYWVAALAERIISDDLSLYGAINGEEASNIPFLQYFLAQ